MIAPFVHISPILLVFALLLGLRRSPLQSAGVAVVWAAIVWLMDANGFFGNVDSEAVHMANAHAAQLYHALQDTAVLFASTAAVIAPGLALVMLIERTAANTALAEWVKALGWKPYQQVMFIALGLAPLLEAMTGFGVSLIATIPLLLALFTRTAALRIAVAGMAIMPWGTLGLATLIGAALSGISANTLAQASAIISAPVFFAVSACALIAIGARNIAAWWQLFIAWLLFMSVLYVARRGDGRRCRRAQCFGVGGVGRLAPCAIFRKNASSADRQTCCIASHTASCRLAICRPFSQYFGGEMPIVGMACAR